MFSSNLSVIVILGVTVGTHFSERNDFFFLPVDCIKLLVCFFSNVKCMGMQLPELVGERSLERTVVKSVKTYQNEIPLISQGSSVTSMQLSRHPC